MIPMACTPLALLTHQGQMPEATGLCVVGRFPAVGDIGIGCVESSRLMLSAAPASRVVGRKLTAGITRWLGLCAGPVPPSLLFCHFTLPCLLCLSGLYPLRARLCESRGLGVHLQGVPGTLGRPEDSRRPCGRPPGAL